MPNVLTIELNRNLRLRDGAIWTRGSVVKTTAEELAERQVPADAYRVLHQTAPPAPPTPPAHADALAEDVEGGSPPATNTRSASPSRTTKKKTTKKKAAKKSP
ncbi:MAG: hypothetical protein AAF797_07055 [Planctomycetota bacterium]